MNKEKQPLLISIGKNCQTKYQINKFMVKNYNDYKEERFFFDWLYGDSLIGVAKAFKNNLIFDKKNIIPFKAKNGYIPFDEVSELKFLHDFTGYRFYNSIDECKFHINNCLPEFIEKYNYLAQKTLNYLLNESAVLVYYGNIKLKEYLLFSSILKDKNINIRIINIYDQDKESEFIFPQSIEKNYINVSYPVNNSIHSKIQTKDEWQGNDFDWQNNLIKALKSI